MEHQSHQLMHSRASLHRQGKSLIMLFILLVAQLYASDGWQASGTWEPGQYEAVRVAIDDAFDNGLTDDEFACNISTTLNNQFGRFWNVVSGKVRDLQYDAVLFGFAHKGHWFWINNYRNNKFVIVWKDYNCGTEFSRSWGDTTDDFDSTGMTDSAIYNQNTGSSIFAGVKPSKDIWAGLYTTIRDLQNKVPTTISGVAALGGFSELAVCICHLTGGDWLYEAYGAGDATQWFAFETRAQNVPLAPILAPPGV